MDVEENKLIVGQNLLVEVEEILPDLILVSFKHKEREFRGILLDSTKKQMPCGVYSQENNRDPNGSFLDNFYSIGQRHTYFPNCEQLTKVNINKPIVLKKPKNTRMTVRLRPRQVLCSKCQSICNENSESIGSNKLIKPQEGNTSSQKILLLSNNGKYKESRSNRETRQSVHCNNNNNNNSKELSIKGNACQTNSSILIPKLIKLKASDIETATHIYTEATPNDSQFSKISQTQQNTVSSQNTSSETKENHDECKHLKLKLSSSTLKSSCLSLKKRVPRIPKMTISTSNLPVLEFNKDCGIRTRSRGSVDEKIEEVQPVISKVILSTSDTSDKAEKENKLLKLIEISEKEEEKDPLPQIDNLKLHNSSEDVAHLNLPKLTILPINASSKSSGVDKTDKMNLRKKRSIGSMEDLWDETIFDETKKIKSEIDKEKSIVTESVEDSDANVDTEIPKTTPILKISFGPGKGTVLKIPAKSTVSNIETNESEEQTEPVKKNKDIITKAAKKALKRAKKEAQKKALVGPTGSIFICNKSRFGGKSPGRLGGMSPARLSGFSPGRFGGTSPGRFGGASPGRFGGTSPARFGCASPARFGGSSPASLGGMISQRAGLMEGFMRSQSRKHKHKVKHKKKHKDDRKHKSSDENAEPNNSLVEAPISKEETEPLTETTNVEPSLEKQTDNTWKIPNSPDQLLSNTINNPTSPKENFLQGTRHKLSISIKRVSNASYVACDPSNGSQNIMAEPPDESAAIVPELVSNLGSNNIDEKFSSVFEISNLINKPPSAENNCNYLNVSPERDSLNDAASNSSDEIVEVPDFPCVVIENRPHQEEDTVLFMKLNWHDVDSCEMPEGLFKVGDIVWGKIYDFPWWPAKVTCLKISNDCCQGNREWHQAQVLWYGSSTSSIIPTETLQPFLKKFKVRYNKRMLGPYQEAVCQANNDARETLNDHDQAINICESPITASPREVNVVS